MAAELTDLYELMVPLTVEWLPLAMPQRLSVKQLSFAARKCQVSTCLSSASRSCMRLCQLGGPGASPTVVIFTEMLGFSLHLESTLVWGGSQS